MKEADNMQTVQGIGLFKIDYELDIGGAQRREHSYQAGVIAYSSTEAVEAIRLFSIKKFKKFKGMRIDQVAFQGHCHALSDEVRDAVIRVAVGDGLVLTPSKAEEEGEEKPKKAVGNKKKSILNPTTPKVDNRQRVKVDKED